MLSTRSQLLDWIEGGAIAAEDIPLALSVTGVTPDIPQWRRFLDQLLLALGALSLAFAVVFFIAYNWDALGRFAQFGLVQALLVIAVVFYWRLGMESLSAKLALLVAAILLGTLLALYGQTYQTGADPWQLFATWAVLILPWVLVGRFAPLWLLWLALLNLAIYLYYDTFFGFLGIAFAPGDDLVWILTLFNSAAWVLWELAARRFEWLAGAQGSRWAVRLIAVTAGYALTALVLRAIFDPSSTPLVTWPVYLAWLLIIYFVYRRKLPDLFMLAGACLSLIVCITSVFVDLFIPGNTPAGVFLLLALLVVAQAAAAAIWLRRIHREQSA